MSWRQVFQGVVEGRPVTLLFYAPTGDLMVKTVQGSTEVSSGSFEQGSTVFPAVISKGQPIEIEGSNADELEANLQSDGGFTERGAKEVASYARNPGIPVTKRQKTALKKSAPKKKVKRTKRTGTKKGKRKAKRKKR